MIWSKGAQKSLVISLSSKDGNLTQIGFLLGKEG